jgi:hypothetical protein
MRVKVKSPYLTLGAGLVLAIVILILNMHATKIAKKSNTAYNAGTPTAPAVSPPATTPATAPGGSTPPASPTSGATAPAVAVPAGTYAGYTDGGTASIAIAIHKGVAIAYLCSGKIESWLQGTATLSPFTMTGTHNGRLTATLTGTKLHGTVTAAGKTFLFTIKAVHPPSGLYRAAAEVRNARVVAGWIKIGSYTIGMLDNGTTEVLAPNLPPSLIVPIDGGSLTAVPIDGESGSGF